MAKNWKVGEAAVAIKSGSTEDKLDIGRRFPLFAILVAQTNEAGIELLNMVPDYVTARKIEAGLKGEVVHGEEGEAEVEVEEAEVVEVKAPAKAKAAAKPAAKEVEDEYAGKSAKDLFTLAKERGIKVEPKQPAEVYAKALKAADAKAAKAKPAPKVEEAEDDWDEEEAPAPKAPAKAAAKAKAKPAEDDDWDI